MILINFTNFSSNVNATMVVHGRLTYDGDFIASTSTSTSSKIHMYLENNDNINVHYDV